MIKKTLISVASLLLITLGAVGAAQAQTVVVNTGAPSTSDVGGTVLDSNDYIDGQINLTGPQTITSIRTFLDDPFGSAGDNFDITLYADNGSNKIGAALFSGTASYNGTTGWNGLSGLNWSVIGGTYWVGLQVTSDEGSNFVATTGAPNLLTNTAFSANGGSNYTYRNISGTGLNKDLNFGLTVSSIAAVPEPDSWLMWLTGIAVAGLFLLRRLAHPTNATVA